MSDIDMYKAKLQIGQAVIDIANTTTHSVNDVIELLKVMSTMAQLGNYSDLYMKPEIEKITMDEFLKELDKLTEDHLKGFCKDLNHLVGVRLGYYLASKHRIKEF